MSCSTCAYVSSTASGSPGPLDKNTPSGAIASTSAAGVFQGTTMRSHPARTRPSRIPRLTPQSYATTRYGGLEPEAEPAVPEAVGAANAKSCAAGTSSLVKACAAGQLTVLTRFSPTSWGASARRCARMSKSSVSVETMPICEPQSRRCCTRARVSTPSMATIPCWSRYSTMPMELRQLDGVRHMSRTTMPRRAGAAAGRLASPGYALCTSARSMP